jgi:hypothetical protein
MVAQVLIMIIKTAVASQTSRQPPFNIPTYMHLQIRLSSGGQSSLCLFLSNHPFFFFFCFLEKKKFCSFGLLQLLILTHLIHTYGINKHHFLCLDFTNIFLLLNTSVSSTLKYRNLNHFMKL